MLDDPACAPAVSGEPAGPAASLPSTPSAATPPPARRPSGLVGEGSVTGAEPPTAGRHRFRVRTAAGETLDCELIGELVGPAVRQGDVVEVYGRRARRGTVRVREVVHPADGATTTARRGRPRPLAALGALLALVIVVLVLVLLTQKVIL